MNRRAFGGRLTLAVLAAPRIARAQSARKVYRIGVLGLSPTTAAMVGPEPQNAFVGALVGGLRSLGYVYGEHFVTEPRGAEGKAERYPILVAELLRFEVDVIVGVAASVPVLKSATSTIPIVMPGFDDPVGEGIVQSLARPGGNITGMTFQSVELTGKQLELLREVVPKGTVAILRDQS